MRRLHILPFLLLACCACTNDLDFEYRQMPRELLLSSQLRSNAGTHTVFAAMGDARRIQSADGLQITCYVNGARIADAVPGDYESVSASTALTPPSPPATASPCRSAERTGPCWRPEKPSLRDSPN